MIPATQREALAVLAEIVDLSPDIRLGQLLAVLYHHRGELAARRAAMPNQGLQLTGKG